MLVARDDDRLHEVADRLPGPAVVVAGDVTDAAAVERGRGGRA